MPPYETLVRGDTTGYSFGLGKCVEKVINELQLRLDQFDAIAFRGTSGALVAGPVSIALKKNLILVRKPAELDPSTNQLDRCSHGNLVEGDYRARTYIVLDDFTSSGHTLRSIVRQIADCPISSDLRQPPKLVGVYLYASGGWHDTSDPYITELLQKHDPYADGVKVNDP